MKHTLHTFFEKTAYSRDASEFLLRYHSIEPTQFLLMIPVLHSEEQCADFLAEVQFLLALELFPTLLIAEHFVDLSFKHQLLSQLGSASERPLEIQTCSEVTFLTSLVELTQTREFYKVMWTGGALHNIKEDVLNRVQLYRLKEACSLEGERALAWIRPFLESYGPSHSVQMVEAHQILPELFTHHGVGTLVSLGYHIIESDLSHCDAQALRRLLERGFGRPLKEGYFENLACGSKVLLEEKGRGVIVLEPWDDVLYLDKLVVEPQFLGQGLGSILLEELTQRLEELSGQGAKLCWRARMDNPYLSRYATMVHGFSKHHAMACGTLADGHYVYHFIGLKGQALDRVIEKMKSRPSSFS